MPRLLQMTENATHMAKEQLLQHYEIERELANKLRAATRDERRSLYSTLYNELYQRIPYHSQLRKKVAQGMGSGKPSARIRFLKRYLKKDAVFLEIGAGSCALSIQVAELVKMVCAVDVSDEIVRNIEFPDNLIFLLTDGCTIPLSDNSVHVAFSDQLIEHLHPDDTIEQLRNIYDTLQPGGTYICMTPNRLNGPHDISKYFSTTAQGLHLREYTIDDLGALFRSAGFRKVSALAGARGRYITVPLFSLVIIEKLLLLLPHRIRKVIADSVPFRILLGCRVIGTKE
jgi:SAM-dependent methyltransferase